MIGEVLRGLGAFHRIDGDERQWILSCPDEECFESGFLILLPFDALPSAALAARTKLASHIAAHKRGWQ